jgi:guanyl-specific ribonuclease Sa
MIRRTTRFVLLVFIGSVLGIGSTGDSVAQIGNLAETKAQDSDAIHIRPSHSTTSASIEPPTGANRQTEDPPQKARALLQTIQDHHGEPPPGYVGGGAFHNREQHLPKGRYREYDVNPKLRGRPRDGERIVIEEKTGKAYYTGDHYRTFIPLN